MVLSLKNVSKQLCGEQFFQQFSSKYLVIQCTQRFSKKTEGFSKKNSRIFEKNSMLRRLPASVGLPKKCLKNLPGLNPPAVSKKMYVEDSFCLLKNVFCVFSILDPGLAPRSNFKCLFSCSTKKTL